jgi:hypothetical protein
MSNTMQEILVDVGAGFGAAVRSRRFRERILWLLLAIAVSGRGCFFVIGITAGCMADHTCGWSDFSRYVGSTIGRYYFDFLWGVIVLMFPIVFSLIFGVLPFEAARERLRLVKVEVGLPRGLVASEDGSRGEVLEGGVPRSLVASEDGLKSEVRSEIPSALLLASQQAKNSSTLASNIYSRSGVYLLVGVFVAFSGLLFFYLRSIGISVNVPKGMTLWDHFFQLAPNFGILFFIEFVAFFFLRQYRSALDEFRYYEALKRRREENVTLMLLIRERAPDVDIFKILEKVDLYSSVGKLSQGETTEILEARKLQKDELELVDKFIELIGKLRG